MARARRSRHTTAVNELLVLDADGLSKAAAGNRTVVAWIQRAQEQDADIIVSAVTLAETLRDTPRDATRHRVLKFSQVWPIDEALGRRAGALLGDSGPEAAIDALVAVTALAARERLGSPRALVLTSDPDDLGRLLADYPQVRVVGI